MFSHHLLATKFRTSTQRSIIAVRAISQALIEAEDCWTKTQQQKNKPQEVVTHYRVAASWGFFNITQPQGLQRQFQSNVTIMVAISVGTQSACLLHRFNLTQPVRAVTANLYKRGNKLSCILYNICLFF